MKYRVHPEVSKLPISTSTILLLLLLLLQLPRRHLLRRVLQPDCPLSSKLIFIVFSYHPLFPIRFQYSHHFFLHLDLVVFGSLARPHQPLIILKLFEIFLCFPTVSLALIGQESFPPEMLLVIG